MRRLKSRGTACKARNSNSDKTGSGHGNNAEIKVDPRIRKYINTETMELNEICPDTPVNPLKIPVCSSPRKGDTNKWPAYSPYWYLSNAQRSILSLQQYPQVLKRTDNIPLFVVTVGVLLSCIDRRFIFCCMRFTEKPREPYLSDQPMVMSCFNCRKK